VAVNSGKAAPARPGEQDAPAWDEGGWRRHAACRDEDPELFFPVGLAGPALARAAEAKAACARCPVREACLNFALSAGQDYGIWGGLTEDERRNLRRRQQRATGSRPAAGRPHDHRLAG
jgi:WhiB family redox-sensing transcriptional regulator